MIRQKLVILSGAGISAESGLNTFRDNDGLWEGYDVQEVASLEGWVRDPARVLEFYNQRRKAVTEASSNAAHTQLADLEKWYEVTIITQNIDDLHERGGSSLVIHLHGEIFKMRSCSNPELIYEIRGSINLGDQAADGGQLRPHIVWFGEQVPMIGAAIERVRMADLFVLIGTSLNVYPAAGLMDYLPPGVPKYIIDRKIPPVKGYHNLHLIEQPATAGVKILLDKLKPPD
ncbi:MAG TPA: Sir2 family NAD-dependent protein deacetylase [Chitinophagaceae bacterium]|nr:Sir2 family NAD-dependent protein deacetylase [Chitinophagaceae bacterium]